MSVDLNDFFGDPSVTIRVDGSSALIEEDPTLASVLLANDPIFFNDPNVIIPAANTVLNLGYDFIEGAGNDDEFRVTLFDFNTVLGDFFTDMTSSGLISFDISGFVGQTLGLQLELRSFDNFFDSTVNIFDVSLDMTKVPLPAAWILLLFGLTGLFSIKSKRK